MVLILKTLLLGEGGVGKTSISQQYVNASFKESYRSTIGVDILYKQIFIENERFDLQLFDFSGQSFFKEIRARLYVNSQGAVLICDLSNAKTLEALHDWIADSREGVGRDIPYILSANKIDLEEEREISHEQILAFCKQYNIPFHYSSAKTGFNLDLIFGELTQTMVDLFNASDK